MKVLQTKEPYSEPLVQVFSVLLEDRILAFSGGGAGLSGSGVDESDADDNGSIW